MKKLLIVVFAILASGLWADDAGVVEPAGKDEALVILSMKFPRFLVLDPGPNVVYLMTIDPWISNGYSMGKDGELFYMGNLKVGRTYRIDTFVAAEANTQTMYRLGWQGNDGFAFTVEKPGILYLGDFEYNDTDRMHPVGKAHELQLLKKLAGNFLFRPTWKALVDQRIKELS